MCMCMWHVPRCMWHVHVGHWRLPSPPQVLAAWIGELGEHRLAYGDRSGTVSVWDSQAIVDGARLYKRGSRPRSPQAARVHRFPRLHADWVTHLAYTPSLCSGALLSSGMDGGLKATDLRTGAVVRSYEGHARGVYSFAVSEPTGKIASAGLDRAILLHSLAAPQPMATLEGHLHPVVQIVAEDDFAQITSLDASGAMRVWDVRMLRCLQVLNSHLVRTWSTTPCPHRVHTWFTP